MSALLKFVPFRFAGDQESERDGQALVEYAMIILLVVIACLAIVTALGTVVTDGLWGMTRQLPFNI